MGFLAAEPAPAQSVERVILNAAFWPDIEPGECREAMRLDGTVTPARLRSALVESAGHVNGQLAAWRRLREAEGHKTLADISAEHVDGESINVARYRRAVHCSAAAILVERLRNFDATGKSATHAAQQRTDAMADDYRREALWAIRDIQGADRTLIDLI